MPRQGQPLFALASTPVLSRCPLLSPSRFSDYLYLNAKLSATAPPGCLGGRRYRVRIRILDREHRRELDCSERTETLCARPSLYGVHELTRGNVRLFEGRALKLCTRDNWAQNQQHRLSFYKVMSAINNTPRNESAPAFCLSRVAAWPLAREVPNRPPRI